MSYLGRYCLASHLGAGSYGSVHLAHRVDDGCPFAIKTIPVGRRRANSAAPLHMAKEEIAAMKSLRHEHIIKLAEVIETSDALHLVMELAQGGDLRNYINSHGPLSESDARAAFLQLVDAIRHAHKLGFIHRDLKLDNILMDGAGRLKVADWGFATRWSPSGKLSLSVGSIHYTAPEMLRGQEYTGPEVDCWSLGVILFALVTATLPFMSAAGESDERPLRERICNGVFELPGCISSSCASLIRSLLEVNPTRRFTLEDVLNHPWIRSADDSNSSSSSRKHRPATPRMPSRSALIQARPNNAASSAARPALIPKSPRVPDAQRMPADLIIAMTRSQEGSRTTTNVEKLSNTANAAAQQLRRSHGVNTL